VSRQVKERDLYACVCCGGLGSDAHHIEWFSDGGADTPNNMVTLCKACHRHVPGPDEFLAFQKAGGSAAALFLQMTADQRCAWHLFGWWTHPVLKADKELDSWRAKSEAALEKSGRLLSPFMAPHLQWEQEQ